MALPLPVRLLPAAAAAVAGGWALYSRFGIDHRVPLGDAIDAPRRTLDTVAGRIAYYVNDRPAPGADTRATPVLLVHSVNAAASAAEVRPIFERLRDERPVYALDLPGFGHSERTERPYTPAMMTSALLAMVAAIGEQHPGLRVDGIALSLGCEFLARAALDRPGAFRTLTLVSPTGFERGAARRAERAESFEHPLVRAALRPGGIGQPLFDLLVTRPSIRLFLERAWGSGHIDPRLLEYAYASSHRPGARHAPIAFLAGALFSVQAPQWYDALALPVWVAHGTRGSFTDYTELPRRERDRGWQVSRYDTGAFPHFEDPARFERDFRMFVTRATA